MNALPFKESAELTADEFAVREWLTRNRETIAGRGPDEIAYLAVRCGFSLDVVCRTMANFLDGLGGFGGHVDSRAAFQAWRFDQAYAQFKKVQQKQKYVKELDLRPQWKELVANTVTGQEER